MWHNNRYEHSNEIEEASLKSFGGGSGISENSRLAFGETIASHLKCELLSTNKQKKISFTKRKKDEKRKKRRKTQSYCHIIFESPFLSSTKKLKPAIHY